MWQQWVTTILGLWILALTFSAIEGSSLTWTLALTGLVIAALGVWGATAHSEMEREGRYAIH